MQYGIALLKRVKPRSKRRFTCLLQVVFTHRDDVSSRTPGFMCTMNRMPIRSSVTPLPLFLLNLLVHLAVWLPMICIEALPVESKEPLGL